MTLLTHFLQTPLAAAIGWSLLHFLWEGALIAAVLSLLLACARHNARLRYAFACIALLAMAASFAITLAVMQPGPRFGANLPILLAAPLDATSGPLRGPIALPWQTRLREALPWLVGFWAVGVLVFAMRSIAGWAAAQRLRRSGVCAASDPWNRRFRAICETLHLSTTIELLESCRVDVPVVIGFLRPTVLMPVGLLMGLPTDQVESILIHELAHIRRRDYLVNLVQTAAECLLFYHPAVWWVSRVIRTERENCCDDLVVQIHGDARRYAAALATLETLRCAEPALAATGGNLMNRIHRLIRQPERSRSLAAPIIAAGLLLVSIGIAMGEFSQAQTPVPPERKQGQSKQGSTLTADNPYRKWLTEDVAYIITDAERSAFRQLTSDEEREHFIQQFWDRRDPTPGTPENEFKEEIYRRVAYTNQHYAAQIAGWKTDRGRIYITYGPTDEIESHPNGSSDHPIPFEQWRYRWIDGVGENVIIEFDDTDRNGEYRMTMDPNQNDALRLVLPPGTVPHTGGRVEVNAATVRVVVTGTQYAGHPLNILGRVVQPDGRPVFNFQESAPGSGTYEKAFPMKPGSYRLVLVVKDTVTNVTAADNLTFEVK